MNKKGSHRDFNKYQAQIKPKLALSAVNTSLLWFNHSTKRKDITVRNASQAAVKVFKGLFAQRRLSPAVGEFVGGVTPHLWGEAFAFKSVATNLHCQANASPLPAQFRGEGYNPSLIDQQLLFNRQVFWQKLGCSQLEKLPSHQGLSDRYHLE